MWLHNGARLDLAVPEVLERGEEDLAVELVLCLAGLVRLRGPRGAVKEALAPDAAHVPPPVRNADGLLALRTGRGGGRGRAEEQGEEMRFTVTTAKYPPQDVLAGVGIWEVETGRRGQ